MKNRILRKLFCFCLLPSAFCLPLLCLPAFGQGTAFTYQGRLNVNGNPASGIYDLRFTIYDSTNAPGTVVAGPFTNSATGVSNGLFTVTLDFGAGVFTGANRWLEIAARSNSPAAFTTLLPRQALTPSPYAIFAGGVNASGLTGTIPSASLGGTYSNPLTLNNGANSFSGTFYGQFLGLSFIGGSFSGAFVGDGSGLINLNASQLSSGTVPDARLSGNIARSNQVWTLSGNAGTTPGVNFMGTTDSQPVEFRVANDRIFRFQTAPEVPSIVGGSASNTVATGIRGATIAGGGLPPYPNTIGADFGTIGGGTFHIVNGPWGTIAGGRDNRVHAESSTVAGGYANVINSNSFYSTIAGGVINQIGEVVNSGTIGGGQAHGIGSLSHFGTVGGGYHNIIQSNAAYSVISGGADNTLASGWSIIAGGQFNSIGSNALFMTVSGGGGNNIRAYAFGSTIAGGTNHEIQTNATYSAIGGGLENRIGEFSAAATIGGGRYNRATGDEATVAGGALNNAVAFAATVGGGGGNRVEGLWSVVAGGRDNLIQSNANYMTIGGGSNNRIGVAAPNSTIGGGLLNQVYSNTFYATIGGGALNEIGSEANSSTIAGGWNNKISIFSSLNAIGGGYFNSIDGAYSTIAGGVFNTNFGLYCAIPGGASNVTSGSYSLAAGREARAVHSGTFVWADSTGGGFSSITTNEFAVRAMRGARFVTSGAGLTVDGQPVLAGTVGGSQLSGTYTSAVTFNNAGNSFTGNGSGLANVNAATVGGLTPSSFWQLGGNSVFPGQFLGSTNNGPLEFRVNNSRSMRFELDGSGSTAHVIGGSRSNGVPVYINGVFATTVGGGGSDSSPNVVSDDFATIGGGFGNIAGNTNNAFDRTGPTVGGGDHNTASGSYSTIPGGRQNQASGDFSFAAGNRARATNQGAFVWGDSTSSDIISTNNDSVTMRASGGYRLYSNSGATLGVFLAAGGNSWASISDRNAKKNFQPLDSRQVLEKLAQLPVQKWNYKTEADDSVPHIGPMAQDFKEAFYPGRDDRSISTLEFDGVELAAIQGLNQKLQDKDAEIQQLKQRLERLEQLISQKDGGAR